MILDHQLSLFQFISNTIFYCFKCLFDWMLPNHVKISNNINFVDALSPSDVASALNLHKLTGNKWFIHGACATTGEGVYESLKEMAHMVKEHKKSTKRWCINSLLSSRTFWIEALTFIELSVNDLHNADFSGRTLMKKNIYQGCHGIVSLVGTVNKRIMLSC